MGKMLARFNQKFTDDQLIDAVSKSVSVSETARRLGLKLNSGTHSHLKKRIVRAKIDTSHFLGQAHLRGTVSTRRKTAEDIFVEGTELDYRQKASLLRRALTEAGTNYECNICGLSEWMGVKMVLEIDHINEKYWDNRKENLQFLCPNCHAIKGR